MVFKDSQSFSFDFMEGLVTCIFENGVAEYFWKLNQMGVMDLIVGTPTDNIEKAKEVATMMIENGYLEDSIKIIIEGKIENSSIADVGSYQDALDVINGIVYHRK